MNVRPITLPYHLDREAQGTGAGPERLMAAGLESAIARRGHEVSAVETVRLDRDHGHEIGNIFALIRALALRVRAAREAGELPIVLAGSCYNAIGVMSGLGAGTGLVWLDAHGDANTPETTGSGFFDGMGLAVLLGWCWSSIAHEVPGFATLDGNAVVHLGGRMFDPGEREAMADGGVTVIDAAAMRAPEGESLVSGTMRDLATATTGVHVHLDLDVIDRSDGVASAYGADGGPSLETLERALTAVATAGRLTSATICSYNPEFDGDGRAARCGVRLLEALLTAST